jgi:DNA-binding response OmpR family regulator
VDDDKAVCDLTASMLEMKGYLVFRAANGEDAIKVFKHQVDSIQLLVTDIVMPSMSGPQLAQQLRMIRSCLPVLFMSGLVSYGNFSGVMGGWFLRKPYTPQMLAEKVKEVLAAAA